MAPFFRTTPSPMVLRKPQVTAKPNVPGMQVMRRVSPLPPPTDEERQDLEDLGIPVPKQLRIAQSPEQATQISQLEALRAGDAQLAKLLEDNFRIAYINALLAQPQPVGVVYASKLGTIMTSSAYVELFKNTRPRPVALQVFGEWAGASVQCYLSRSTDLSHEQVVDVIGAQGTGYPANGNTQSRVILVPPQGFIYIAPVDFTNFPPTANDKFRIKVWSPDEWMDANSFTNR